MYVRISPHLPRFQVWPLKSRLFRSQSIDSERKQKNAQNTNIKCEVKNLKTRRNPVSFRKLHFCKRRVWMQVKVRKFPWIEAIRFSEFSSNSWNSTINVVGIGNPGWSRTRSELVCCEAWWLGSNNPDELQGGYLCWRKYCWFSYFSPVFCNTKFPIFPIFSILGFLSVSYFFEQRCRLDTLIPWQTRQRRIFTQSFVRVVTPCFAKRMPSKYRCMPLIMSA